MVSYKPCSSPYEEISYSSACTVTTHAIAPSVASYLLSSSMHLSLWLYVPLRNLLATHYLATILLELKQIFKYSLGIGSVKLHGYVFNMQLR